MKSSFCSVLDYAVGNFTEEQGAPSEENPGQSGTPTDGPRVIEIDVNHSGKRQNYSRIPGQRKPPPDQGPDIMIDGE